MTKDMENIRQYPTTCGSRHGKFTTVIFLQDNKKKKKKDHHNQVEILYDGKRRMSKGIFKTNGV